MVPETGSSKGYNNARGIDAYRAIEEAYANPDGVLMHNAKFDVDVIETHFGLAPPPPERVHDTMFLAFLDDPNARQIDLKSVAKRLLDWPTEERDALNDWLTENQPVPDVRISTSLKGKNPPGKYIAYAPTYVVGPYAIGDVERTAALFGKLYPEIVARDMLGAYRREQNLLPVLLDMERRGVAVDLEALRSDVESYQRLLARLEAWVRRRIDADPAVNVAAGGQLIEALVAAGEIDTGKLLTTKKTGDFSATKKSIAGAVEDKQLAATLQYAAQLRTCLHTFMEPWLRTAERSRGLIYTQWHQTRGGGGGARTGRLSSSPNFQNIPVEFEPHFSSDARRALTQPSRIETKKLKVLVKTLPKAPFTLPPLPLCRKYIVAYKGGVLIGRDFMSQELRILAHFEDAGMMQAYLDDPAVDFHQHATDMMRKHAGLPYLSRREAKIVAWSILYGAGLAKLATQLDCSMAEAKTILNAYHQMFPGIRKFQNDLKFRARSGLPVRTIGGRLYYCEPPAYIDGELRTFDYKMCNTIIQGSAADQTKDAMIKFHHIAGPGKMILSVHDEIVASTKNVRRDMIALRDAINTSTLDIPVLSDGDMGYNWASMEKYDDAR